MQSNQSNEVVVRVVVMGAAKVGKSSIISRFLNGNYEETYKPTVEGFFCREFKSMDSTRSVRLEIVDTSGSFSFPAMQTLYIASADAFILVYSFMDYDSFKEVKSLRQQLVKEKNDENFPIVIVGNKDDLELTERAFSKAEADLSLDVCSGNHIVVSTKLNQNIKDIFYKTLRECRVEVDAFVTSKVSSRRRSLPALFSGRISENSSSSSSRRNSLVIEEYPEYPERCIIS
ncbi:ras-related protein Rap-2a-like [Anneissia japonica]|uniref:ras-related protein Rap-2a-like n=1 Tax=Anneissia japonica TaxID=1529436 RepID=UPI0014255C60|nr:ras-related protein Rap-2a-like [Anneissia japonica]